MLGEQDPIVEPFGASQSCSLTTTGGWLALLLTCQYALAEFLTTFLWVVILGALRDLWRLEAGARRGHRLPIRCRIEERT